jgi:translation initiation factor IF-3
VRLVASAETKRESRQRAHTQGAGTGELKGFMAKANHVEIPYLDPSVQHVGISRLRALNVTQLRELDKTLVIQDNDKPLAVLLKYEHFLAMQEKILKSEGE